MKKQFILLLGLIVFAQGYGQLIEGLSQVCPQREGMSAVEKDGQWAFVNSEGQMVIDFRDDLVLQPSKHQMLQNLQNEPADYPRFQDGLCMIQQTKDGIQYFGFIDQKGKTVIEPIYINATLFSKGRAIVSQYSKKVIGQNKLLGKDVITHQVEDLLIDRQGKTISTLFNARNFVPDKLKSEGPPPIRAVILSESLVAVQEEDSTWSIYQF